ncbi:hypothetical protein BDW59DRAFT_181775 [Aspergillus cavernicola]|uniref:DUF676 domain-containing protein n=1 Tax=Aspergillus cavernicola TaxID=176166 RepID=A0ABR4IVA3_9EURO
MEPAPNANWLKEVDSPPNATLDIVAVHGMNIQNQADHAENTWTDQETETNWLRDLLPEKIPYARILAYCYNANILFGASSAGIQEQARNLLLCLSGKRKATPARPIIFITHSMGGILVKDALAIAYHGDETYASTSRFLNSVEARSADNDELNSRFQPLLEMYRFFTICETKDEVVGGISIGLIVDSDSAILKGCPGQQVAYWPNRTHRSLCKFASTDPEWQLISEMLTGAANLAVKCVFYSPVSFMRQGILQDRLWNPEGTQNTFDPLSEAIEKAQICHNIITQDSQQGGKLYRRQEEINRLNNDVSTSVHWLWSIVLQILGLTFLVPTMLTSLFLPSSETVAANAEKAQAKQQRVMGVEKDIIESLDGDQSWVLGNITVLEGALAAPPPEGNTWPSADELGLGRRLLQNLHLDVERVIFDIRQHNRSYFEARRRVNLIEDAKRETAGRNDTEFWAAIGERAQEEQKLQKRRRIENIQEEGIVCPCVIL